MFPLRILLRGLLMSVSTHSIGRSVAMGRMAPSAFWTRTALHSCGDMPEVCVEKVTTPHFEVGRVIQGLDGLNMSVLLLRSLRSLQ